MLGSGIDFHRIDSYQIRHKCQLYFGFQLSSISLRGLESFLKDSAERFLDDRSWRSRGQ